MDRQTLAVPPLAELAHLHAGGGIGPVRRRPQHRHGAVQTARAARAAVTHFLPLTLPDLADNLALDEALLLAAEERPAGGVLRLWEWPRPAVVLGAGCPLAQDVDEAACTAASVPVLRRASGGGTVLLGPGCLL